MPLTKEYFRYEHVGACGSIASPKCNIVRIEPDVYATGVGQEVFFWNVKLSTRVGFCEAGCSSPSQVCRLAYHRGRQFLAVGYDNGEVCLFDLQNGLGNAAAGGEPPECTIAFRFNRKRITALCFASDGLILAVGSLGTTIGVWDVASNQGVCKLNGHKASITKLQFTKDNSILLSSSKDCYLKMWDWRIGQCVYTLAENTKELYSFVLYADDQRLVTGSVEQELAVYALKWNPEKSDYDTSAKTELRMARNLGQDDSSAQPTSATATNAEDVMMIDRQGTDVVKIEKLGTILRGSIGNVRHLLVSEDEKLLLCMGSKSEVDVFSIKSMSQKKLKRKRKKLADSTNADDEIKVESDENEEAAKIVDIGLVTMPRCDFHVAKGGYPTAISLHSAGSKKTGRKYQLCAVTERNQMSVMELGGSGGGGESTKSGSSSSKWTLNERLGVKVHGHRRPVFATQFTSDDAHFVTASTESIKAWKRSNLEVIHTIDVDGKGEAEKVTAFVLLPLDNCCVFGRKNGTLELWDVVTKECHTVVEEAHNGAVNSLVVSSDKRNLFSASLDKKLKIWSFVRGDKKTKSDKGISISLSYQGCVEFDHGLTAVRLSPNGKYFAVALLDFTVRTHFMDSHKMFHLLHGHKLPVNCMDISSDSKLIVTGGGDKDVRLWDMQFGYCLRSLFAHDGSVSQVLFCHGSHLFWSCGEDSKVKQWDGDKFKQIQILEDIFEGGTSLATSRKGGWLIGTGRDNGIHVWNETEEILVLSEEEENQRELDAAVNDEIDDNRDEDDQKAGVSTTTNVSLRSTDAVIGAERLRSSLETRAKQSALIEADLENASITKKQAAQNRKALNENAISVLKNIKSSDLDNSLLMLSLDDCMDLLDVMCQCIRGNHEIIMAVRVVTFFTRTRYYELTRSQKFVAILNDLMKEIPAHLDQLWRNMSYNEAALEMSQLLISQREDVQLFSVAAGERDKKRKKQKKRETYTLNMR